MTHRIKYFSSVNPVFFHNISYIEFGLSSSENILFCIHGLISNAYDFLQLDEYLQTSCRIIAINLPGRRDSDYLYNSSMYTEEQYIIDISQLINQLRANSNDQLNITLYGHSQGALIALKYASRLNCFVNRIIIGDASPEFPCKYIYKLQSFYGKKAFDKSTYCLLKSKINSKVSSDCDDSYVDKILNNSFYHDTKSDQYLPYFDAENICDAFTMQAKASNQIFLDYWDYWKNLQVKVLLIRHEKSGIVTDEILTKMINLCPQMIQVYTLKGFFHSPVYVDSQIAAEINIFMKT